MDTGTILAIAVILATFLGPVLAVFVTRWVDDRRSKSARKLDTFRVLIRTRRTQLNPDFVAALNMVEIDYYDASKVQTIYADLMRHLNTKSSEHNWSERTQRLVARLLNAMGQNVGYSMEQLDILEGGYIPQGMVDDEFEQTQLRKSLLNVLSGRQPFPVTLQPIASTQSLQRPALKPGQLHDVPPPQ